MRRAFSHTVKLDGQKKDRSYQRESRTYGELVRTVLAPYQGAAIWNGGGGEEKTGAFLMQYRETDWEFLRRVASRQKKPVALAPGRWHIRKSLAKVWSMGDNEDIGRRDGSIVRREGYDDILRDDFLYTYFLMEVCDQDPKYTRTHDQPYVTLYEQWLDDTYGKTELGKFWEYLSTIDGIQAMLDVGGFIFDWCDVINCAIYLCRGKYEEAMWSAVCALPLWGSLIGKGGRKAVSLAGDLADHEACVGREPGDTETEPGAGGAG